MWEEGHSYITAFLVPSILEETSVIIYQKPSKLVPFDPAIPSLAVHSKEIIGGMDKDIYKMVFTIAYFMKTDILNVQEEGHWVNRFW